MRKMCVGKEHVSNLMRITFAVISLSLLTAILLVRVQAVNAFLDGLNEDFHKKVTDTQHTYCEKSSPCTLDISLIFPKTVNISTGIIWKDQIILEQTPCCKPCSCISYTCRTNGDCCPDVYETLNSFSEAHLSRKIFCEPLQLKRRSFENDDKIYPNSEYSVTMYKKCPSIILGRDIRDDLQSMCENENNLDIISNIPVTNRRTRQTYKNIYCAECHGVKEQVDFWDPQIVCNGSSFEATYTDNVVKKVLETENCNIIFSSELPNADRCYVIISRCNVTGKWETWDPVIEKACSAYTAPYMELYRNIFCYICNGVILGGQFCSMFSMPKIDFSFSLVLDFKNQQLLDNRDKFEVDRNCPRHTVYDVLQKTCIEASCIEPKIYINGSCVSFATKIGGVGYRVFLQVIPLLEYIVGDMDKLEEYFLKWLTANGMENWMYTFSVHFMSYDNITASTNRTVAYFVIYFEFYIDQMFPGNVSFIDNLLEMHGTVMNINISERNGDQKPFYARLDSFDVHTANFTEIYLTQRDVNGDLPLKLEKYFVKDFQDIFISGLILFNKDDVRPLLPINRCPLITLNSSFYDINHFLWGVNIDRSNTKLNRSEYEVKQGDRNTTDIRICRKTFDIITEKILAMHASSTHRLYAKFIHIFVLLCFVNSIL